MGFIFWEEESIKKIIDTLYTILQAGKCYGLKEKWT